jgi:type I restriction enzyme S subunit
VLLEKIKAEKARLVQEGKIKKSKKLPAIQPDEVPFDLPQGWEWVRLGDTAKVIEYGTSHKSVEVGENVPIFRMNNIQDGQITFDNLKYVPDSIKDLPRLFLKDKDILFNRTNSYELVGKTGIFRGEDNVYTFASYLIRASIFEKWIDPEFINIALNSSYFRTTQIEPEVTQQCGQANFNGTKLKNSAIPLPPLSEQKRIVTKVNQLMFLCDDLESQLSQAVSDREKLLETAVHQLLAA